MNVQNDLNTPPDEIDNNEQVECTGDFIPLWWEDDPDERWEPDDPCEDGHHFVTYYLPDGTEYDECSNCGSIRL